MRSIAESQSKVRTDIQVLRGFAVLIVLFYHARLGILNAGFLGVDVFFVLSGFLITRVVQEGIERGDFSFRDFYFRRAKRLLPAAYAVFLVTACLAPHLLTTVELRDFCVQMAGAVTFTANIVLWRQSGYFGGAAVLKPLLHVWSLSLEEQYYFVLPATMYFLPRRFWKAVFIGALIASLALCLLMVKRSVATFYLLPTRGWELAIGSLGALTAVTESVKKVTRYLFWPAMAALLALPIQTMFPFHPGPDALVICLATLVVVLRRHPVLSGGPFCRGAGRMGDISYSLYLVHWPIFAFLNNVYISSEGLDTMPLPLRLGAVAMAFLLAYLLNRFIEEPVRHRNIRYSPRVAIEALLVSCMVVAMTFGLSFASVRGKNYAAIRQFNHGLSVACDFNSDFVPVTQCRNSDEPKILVWGDSFAMHLVTGIAGTADPGATKSEIAIVQATHAECGPLLGIAPVERTFVTGADESWARRCIRFNESVIHYLEKAASVDIVVLSSPFAQFLGNDVHSLLKREDSGNFRLIDAGISPALVGLKATVDQVRQLGKKVVVVGPPPQAVYDLGRCLERVQRGMPTIDLTDRCSVDLKLYRRDHVDVLAFLRAVPNFADVAVIDLKPLFCDQDFCKTIMDGTSLYMDGGHFSRDGSVAIAKKAQLLEQIMTAAR